MIQSRERDLAAFLLRRTPVPIASKTVLKSRIIAISIACRSQSQPPITRSYGMWTRSCRNKSTISPQIKAKRAEQVWADERHSLVYTL